MQKKKLEYCKRGHVFLILEIIINDVGEVSIPHYKYHNINNNTTTQHYKCVVGEREQPSATICYVTFDRIQAHTFSLAYSRARQAHQAMQLFRED